MRNYGKTNMALSGPDSLLTRTTYPQAVTLTVRLVNCSQHLTNCVESLETD
jgi:hypothetical protein